MLENDDVKCRFKLKKRITNNTLRGKVQIVANRLLEIQHAYIEITGFASCCFDLGKIRVAFPRIYPEDTYARGFSQFYYTRHTLCGGFGVDNVTFHRGSEFYPFKCIWHSRLPGTWFGDYGSIEYYIINSNKSKYKNFKYLYRYVGKVTIRMMHSDFIYTHSQLINVKFRRDLALEEHLSMEGRVDVSRRFFTTRSVGSIYISVWLPICGIAIGQSLPVICTIINHSKLHFGSLLFLLTRIDIYKSNVPTVAVKTVRTDICRVTRMVNIHRGKFEYYAILQTDQDTIPTNQFFKCKSIDVVYEVWVSVQGAFGRYRSFGYPNVDTPGIPLVIGTKPVRKYDTSQITEEILTKMNEYNDDSLIMDELPEDLQKIIHKTDEELSANAIQNLERQLQQNDEKLVSGLKEEAGQKS